ncbi:hypothetical protein T09_8548 [Trichinella sp. T9]|nr:hypothetical protein T09_8548 [Trichinella sp. T9]
MENLSNSNSECSSFASYCKPHYGQTNIPVLFHQYWGLSNDCPPFVSTAYATLAYAIIEISNCSKQLLSKHIKFDKEQLIF